jgi:hypothetical protein
MNDLLRIFDHAISHAEKAGWLCTTNTIHNMQSVTIIKQVNCTLIRLTIVRSLVGYDVAICEDKFLFGVKFFSWLHRAIPYFPYAAQIQASSYSLPLGATKYELNQSITTTVEKFELKIKELKVS